MIKKSIGPQALLYPAPALLVGANVNDRPNFMTVAWAGIVCSVPPELSISIRQARHTFRGIRSNMTFSVNIPSCDMMKEVDYCGTYSGAGIDKIAACNFTVFYGKLGNAPLIEQCPVNMECSVVHMMCLGSHWLVIGRIEEVQVSEDRLSDAEPDVDRINPLTYVAGAFEYRSLGQVIGRRGVLPSERRHYSHGNRSL